MKKRTKQLKPIEMAWPLKRGDKVTFTDRRGKKTHLKIIAVSP